MTDRSPRKPIAEWNSLYLGLGGVGVLVLVVALVVGISAIDVGRKNIEAEFAQAGEIRNGDQVTLAGVPVGEVKGSRLDGNRVIISMNIDRGIRLGNETKAEIKLTTILGSRYIVITPAGSGSLEDDRVPLRNTRVPYDLQETIEDATTNFEQVDAGGLADAMTTLSTQLEGAPEVVPEAISTAHTLSEIIATRRTQLGELITGAERVTTVIRNQESNIGSLMVQGRNLMVELTRRRDAVHGMFNATTALVAQLHRITVVNRPALDALIEDLNGMLGALARHDDLLRNTLQALPLPVRNFTNATGAGNYIDFTGPAGFLIDSWMCALSGRAEQVGRAQYFEDCR
ncbi:MCE family protein [Gordonia amicalis]|nr:MCE family protein [Gordonia amicalis]UOG23234.1 MCE family protein [Gordonia amicalis]